MNKNVIVIATHQRAKLLHLLLEDISRQTAQPEHIIVVDGDPASGEVLAMLKDLIKTYKIRVHYIPSNHGNLAYQRYLGWRSACALETEFLIYFDDDIRLMDQNTLSTLLNGFVIDTVVGVTASTITGGLEKLMNEPALVDMRKSSQNHWLVDKLGSAKKYSPGGYTPAGNRISPDKSKSITHVEWLQGRVMAYRMKSIDKSCFLEDLFALTHIRCGLGEDTILSRQVGSKGDLLMFHDLSIEHPDDAMPNSYPIKAFHLAYATAYSRRFLNDHYRVTEPPYFSDRAALLKSYLGNNLINFARAAAHPRRHRWAYAWGYLRGSLRGLLQKPTVRNLSPQIDWWKDAEEALRGEVTLRP